MERNEARDIAIKCLLEYSPAKDFFADTFEQYLDTMSDENIPISPVQLENVSEHNNKIIIEENIYNELKNNMGITMRTNREIPYFLIGFEQGNGSIIFKYIKSDISNFSTMEADHNGITFFLENFLKELNYLDIKELGMPIICKGHTHGKSPVSDNFSFGDMISCVSFKSQIRKYLKLVNKNVNPNIIDTVDMLMNPNGDFNLIYYDENQTGFYKFTNIFLKKSNNNIELLPSISPSGNYIKNSRNR